MTNLKIPGGLFRNVYPRPPLLGFFLSIVTPDDSFLKLVIMIEHIKIMQLPHLNICSCQCFFLDKCLSKQQLKSLVLVSQKSWSVY